METRGIICMSYKDGRKESMNMELEESYQEALQLYQCLSCMNIGEAKISMCKKIKKQLEQLGEYKENSKYIQSCEQILKETKIGIKEMEYQEAIYDMEQARTLEAYQRVAKRFEKLGEYKDATQLKQQMKKKKEGCYRRINRRRYVASGIILVVVLGFVLTRIPRGRYYEAKILRSSGCYRQAGKVYQSLGDYKDSKERVFECKYQEGNALREKKKYSDAMNAFKEAEAYKDSMQRFVEMQKKVITERKVGSKIKIGDENWIILKKEEGKALLLRNKSFKNIVFSNNQSKVSWENSSVKEWLNTEFLEKHMTMEECNNIVSYMGASAFILSKEEVEELQSSTKVSIQCKSNQWLRSVVDGTDKVMFLNTNGDIMEEGYTASCDKINVRPAIWYSLQ